MKRETVLKVGPVIDEPGSGKFDLIIFISSVTNTGINVLY